MEKTTPLLSSQFDPLQGGDDEKKVQSDYDYEPSDSLPVSLSSTDIVAQSIPRGESALFMMAPLYPTQQMKANAMALIENKIHDRSDLQALSEDEFQRKKYKIEKDAKRNLEALKLENEQKARSGAELDPITVSDTKLAPSLGEALESLRGTGSGWSQPQFRSPRESISSSRGFRTVAQSFPGKNHYSPKWYKKEAKREVVERAACIKVCQNDGHNQATLFCGQCKRNYCDACSKVIHTKSDKKDHKAQPIGELKMCENDCGKPALQWCVNCPLELRYFCNACDDVLHLNEKVRSHRRLKLQPEASGLSSKEQKVEEKEYFFRDDLQLQASKRIAVVVPCFNEKAEELERTLLSLAHQNSELEVKMGYQLHVLLVVDGWWKTSDSMKRYLTQMFPEDSSQWTRMIGQIRKGEETECVETFILQAVPQESKDHAIRRLERVNIRYTPPPSPDSKDKSFMSAKQLTEYEVAQEKCWPTVTRYLYCFCVLAFISIVSVTAFQVVKGGGDMYANVFFPSVGVLTTLLVCMCCFGVLKVEPIRDPGPKLEKKLKLTVLVKRDNRRKHNSHDWFFAAFCAFYDPEFAFCTDCGTTYEDGCIPRLVQHMRLHTSTVAVTGRQRVMSARDQGNADENLLAFFYRSAQCFDYEASLASFMGAFAFVGMLPVIPGPCGLYRWNACQEAVKFYLETVKKNPDEAGLVEGTLLLAEDRILSYAAVLKAKPEVKNGVRGYSKAKTAYVPRAIFYFEAETDPLTLLQQRRRWINGTMAGYLWLMGTKSDLVWDAPKSLFFKVWILLLVFCQFFLYCVVALSPGIFASGLYFGLLSGFPGDENEITRICMFGTYILVYVAFVAKHINPGDENKLSEWLFHLATLVNAIGVVLVISTTVYYAFENGMSAEIYLVFAIMAAPFVLALQTPSSLPFMFATVIQFYLFLPTMVAYFGAYAFSRSWELTWGNRPSDSLLSMELSVPKSQDEIEKQKKKIIENGKTVGFLIVALNLFLVLTVTVVHNAQPLFILLLSVVIFFFAGIQMGVTFLWVWFKYIPLDVVWWSLKIYVWKRFGWTCCGNTLTDVEKNAEPFEDCCVFV